MKVCSQFFENFLRFLKMDFPNSFPPNDNFDASTLKLLFPRKPCAITAPESVTANYPYVSGDTFYFSYYG